MSQPSATTLPFDPSTLSLTEMIRLQNLLAKEVARRFEVSKALAFVDIARSTEYFARFGDVAGRQLQQLHLDLLQDTIPEFGGRIVDTAGDGAFLCFHTASGAVEGMQALLKRASEANEHRTRDHQLTLHVGIHFGRVLSDGTLVTGDAVNLTARLADTAEPGQIRLSRELFLELDVEHRRLCHPIGTVELRGAARPMELLSLEWHDRSRYPNLIVVRETQQQIALPQRDIVSFGRLEVIEGMTANDIVLVLPDPERTRQISRWHFELRRRSSGYLLRSVSVQSTVVDGVEVHNGQEIPVQPGSVVQLSGVMTLDFLMTGLQVPRTMDRTALTLRPRKPVPPPSAVSSATEPQDLTRWKS